MIQTVDNMMYFLKRITTEIHVSQLFKSIRILSNSTTIQRYNTDKIRKYSLDLNQVRIFLNEFAFRYYFIHFEVVLYSLIGGRVESIVYICLVQ